MCRIMYCANRKKPLSSKRVLPEFVDALFVRSSCQKGTHLPHIVEVVRPDVLVLEVVLSTERYKRSK